MLEMARKEGHKKCLPPSYGKPHSSTHKHGTMKQYEALRHEVHELLKQKDMTLFQLHEKLGFSAIKIKGQLNRLRREKKIIMSAEFIDSPTGGKAHYWRIVEPTTS